MEKLCVRAGFLSVRLGQQNHTTQDAQKCRPARPQRAKARGVPSGAHGATNKEHQVCARRREVRRPGPRWGSERCENAAGRLFQHPAKSA
jgi:hypothetical protein